MQVLYIGYVLFHLYHYGYLPAPFFYDFSDSLMDFYHTNYWAFHEGRYEDWKSLYPIFVFIFSKLFTASSCVDSASPALLRACDHYAVFYLLLADLVGTGCCAWVLVKRGGEAQVINKIDWLKWFGVFSLSIPCLFALERGNYILLAFMFLALANLYEGNWKSALFLAMAINIKQYLVLLWIIPFLKRRYDLVFLGIVFAIIPSVFGLILIPEFHYNLLFQNMFDFSTVSEFSRLEKLWMPTSFSAWVRALGDMTSDQPNNLFLLLVQAILIMVMWLERILYLMILYIAAVYARKLSPAYLAFVVLAGLIACIDGLGGYAMLLLFPFLYSLNDRPKGLSLISLLILVCLPMGWSVGPALEHALEGNSYLGESFLSITPKLTVGSYLRPLLILGLLITILRDLMSVESENANKPLTLTPAKANDDK